jgi:uncharacterized protein
MTIEIPNLDQLITVVLDRATHKGSQIHGEAHWKCVAQTGLELCREIDAADRIVVFLFGLIHDSQRLNDGFDRAHGTRAATFVRQIQSEHMHLSEDRLNRLTKACVEHADGFTSGDPTIGVCWDADRLNLWRLGVQPQSHLLSTEAARQPSVIQRAKNLAGQRMQWDEIFRFAHSAVES